MVVVVIDPDGVFREVYDIRPLLELDEREKQDAIMQGFSIDKEGNFLFTIPPVFRAYKISPDRKVAYFGKAGAGPGRFNVVAGIVADNTGNILVVDKLKCAIMVYDNNFNFLGQFGSRGWNPGSLIAPDEIDIDSQDRIYVTQAGKKGVSVFKITYN
jgi:DNA-binding beta-propeller fold protein YncE